GRGRRRGEIRGGKVGDIDGRGRRDVVVLGRGRRGGVRGRCEGRLRATTWRGAAGSGAAAWRGRELVTIVRHLNESDLYPDLDPDSRS
nr:hypothetical protein [Tanacetum cinerariifolium]